MPQFTATNLLEVQLKVDVMWKDAQVNKFYKAEVEGLRAIRENSAATFEALSDPKVENTVSVNWVTTNNITVTDGVTDNCDIDGPQLATTKKNYALDIFKKSSFSIFEQELKSNIFTREEIAAKGLLEALRQLDEKLATVCMAKADAYAGSNMYPTAQSGYAETNGKTVIPAAVDAPNFFAYMQQAMILNRMRGSYLIENGSMYQQQLVAAFKAGNLDGKGDQAAFGSMPIYNDLFNMTAAGVTSTALLIAPTALAFCFKSRYNAVPNEVGGRVNQTYYSIPSPSLPGVRYDVIYQMECAPGTIPNDTNTKHTWQIMVNAGLFLNPTRFATNTGVLALARS